LAQLPALLGPVFFQTIAGYGKLHAMKKIFAVHQKCTKTAFFHQKHACIKMLENKEKPHIYAVLCL
jgi:hypothetical protein